MKQVLLKRGTIYTADVAVPLLGKDMVLVRTEYSCISAGTEMSGVQQSGEGLVTQAIKHPEYIQMGLEMLKQRGFKDTWDTVHGKYDFGNAMGYSSAGIVEESSSPNFTKGDRVACMGVGYANHAGFSIVPHNLVVKIPDGVSFEQASTAALGCIAMQGVRRADVQLGDFIVICGAGILGQLACRFAVASGATVIVTDVDSRRLEIAKKAGASYVINVSKDNPVKIVTDITNGQGADKVILTAATSSNDLISQGFQMCRRRGTVVLVGVAGMNLKREDMYKKELEFKIATSYGPGRYDQNYEEEGKDYPYGYVRYTEQRNLEAYLRLIANNRITIDEIIEQIFDASEADKAYQALKSSENRPLIVLLKYPHDVDDKDKVSTIEMNSSYKPKSDVIKIALCGAGGFAKGMHLPNIQKMQDKYSLYAVQSRTASNAQSIALKYRCKYATTDYEKILNDSEVDMVMICTRHNLHAQMVIEALKAKKAVFVEKPLALNKEETQAIMETVKETGMPLLVGYNRRFSKYAQEIKKHIKDRINPLIVNYTMNAGFIPLDCWIQKEEGGGRIIGEGCHILDLFTFFTDSEAESVSVNNITPKTQNISGSDNCVITVKYKDGSLCNLIYTGQGNKIYRKEYCEVFCDGNVYVIDDYKKLISYGKKVKHIESAISEKGQFEEMVAYYNSIKNGNGYPIPLWQLEQTSIISFMRG